MNYSQNNEQEIIQDYFKDHKGTFLDIGANDGITLSNTHALALNGWKGYCIEPSPIAFGKLCYLYTLSDIKCINVAITQKDGPIKFYESGTHLNQGDTSLLSSVVKSETTKWKKTTDFKEIEVDGLTWESFMDKFEPGVIDFLSIDAEGLDLDILKQIDLAEIKCKMICIEWNSDLSIRKKISQYLNGFGLKLVSVNYENLIFAI
jgi:FkbM family methyltransferase